MTDGGLMVRTFWGSSAAVSSNSRAQPFAPCIFTSVSVNSRVGVCWHQCPYTGYAWWLCTALATQQHCQGPAVNSLTSKQHASQPDGVEACKLIKYVLSNRQHNKQAEHCAAASQSDAFSMPTVTGLSHVCVTLCMMIVQQASPSWPTSCLPMSWPSDCSPAHTSQPTAYTREWCEQSCQGNLSTHGLDHQHSCLYAAVGDG